MSSTQLFASTLQKTNEWLKEIARGLGTADLHAAYTALRATLHAIRDHLNVDEAAQLSAQLPLLVRGIFFEGWNPLLHPRRPNNSDAFFETFWRHSGNGEVLSDPESATRIVLKVLRRHVSPGEMDQVMAQLPAAIREL
jgi:uncharacterized protein (DUF2267 family)